MTVYIHTDSRPAWIDWAMPKGEAWREQAACIGTDPSRYDPAANASADELRRIHKAFRVCAGCPVIGECAASAVEWQDSGVRGGQMFSYGMVIAVNAPKPTGPAPKLVCGTDSAYRQHRARDEPACDPCLDAHARYGKMQAARKRRYREKKKLEREARQQAEEAS